MDQLTALLSNMDLVAELPDEYTGELQTEFETVVSLFTLGFLARAYQQQDFANRVWQTCQVFVHQVNKFQFGVFAERANRLSEDDVELAQRHALNHVSRDHSTGTVIVSEDTMILHSRATANLCHDMIQHIEFVLTMNRPLGESGSIPTPAGILGTPVRTPMTPTTTQKATKQTFRKHRQLAAKIIQTLKSLTTMLDSIQEAQHMYMDKSTLDISELTENERHITVHRKRRGR